MSGDSPLSRRFHALALPMVLANITVPLAGLVDAAMLGHLDDPRFLGGVALGSIVFDYVFWTFGFLRMATTGQTAQARGSGDTVEAARVGLRAMFLGAVIGTALIGLAPLLVPAAFALLEGEEGVREAGRAYTWARMFGAPAALTNFAITGWLLGQERGRAVLVVAAITNAVNIVLDWLFIAQWGWAAAGAGYATAIAQGVGLVVGLALVWGAADWSSARKGLWDRAKLTALMALNRDIVVRTLALVSAFAIFTDFSAVLGVTVLAANAVMLKVLSTAAWFIDGLAFAVESLVGQFHGAGDRRQMRALFKLAVGESIAVGLLTAAAFTLFPGPLFGILTDQPALLGRLAADAPILFGLLGFGSVAYVLDGWFLGISDGPAMRNAMVVSLVIGFLPLALAGRWLASPNLLWAALVVFMVARVLTLGRQVQLGRE